MKSILTDNSRICYRCGGKATDMHHIFHGTANRAVSEEFGLKVPLCRMCHTAVHTHIIDDNELKKIGQVAFQEEYPELDFRGIFGKNYI